MDYVTQDDLLLVLRQSAAPQAPRIILEVLDLQGQILGSIEGLVSGNISISADSDVRRTGSVVIQPTRTQNIMLTEDNLVWLDKDVHMKIGLYNAVQRTYVWYSMGYFTYTNTSVNYDATNNQLTVNLSDFMTKLDGTKNGALGYLTMTFPAKPGDYDYYGGQATGNAYTLTIDGYDEYDATNEGELIGFYATNTNGESPTVNINGLGVQTILSYRTTEGLEAGRIQAGHINILRIETTRKEAVVTKNVYFDSYLESDHVPELKTPSVIRNVILEVLKQYAPFVGDNYIVGDIGAPRAFENYYDDWEQYRKDQEGLWNTVPYDQEFSAGTSVLNILTTFRDLYAGYFEMFFEPEHNTFICQILSTFKNDANFIENSFIQRVLISESTTVDLNTVRNVCEVWGQTFEPDFYGTEVTYSGNVYSCHIEGYEDTYYNGDIVALKIPQVNNAASPAINLNGFGNVTIYNESTYLPIEAEELAEVGTHVFKVSKKRNSETKQDEIRFFHLGMWQVHALNVLTDGSTQTKDYTFSDGTVCKLYSKEYFQKKYNVIRVDFETASESPFTIQKLGEILDVKTGGDYDKITSDDDAAYRAKIENYKNCRLTDNIQITTALMPFLDVNKKVSYKPFNDAEEHEYIIKSISHDFAGFTSQITLVRYYEDAA